MWDVCRLEFDDVGHFASVLMCENVWEREGIQLQNVKILDPSYSKIKKSVK